MQRIRTTLFTFYTPVRSPASQHYTPVSITQTGAEDQNYPLHILHPGPEPSLSTLYPCQHNSDRCRGSDLPSSHSTPRSGAQPLNISPVSITQTGEDKTYPLHILHPGPEPSLSTYYTAVRGTQTSVEDQSYPFTFHTPARSPASQYYTALSGTQTGVEDQNYPFTFHTPPRSPASQHYTRQHNNRSTLHSRERNSNGCKGSELLTFHTPARSPTSQHYTGVIGTHTSAEDHNCPLQT